MMLVPVPSIALDLMLAASVTLGILVLLSALYILKPVQFSVFPTLLLLLTLFRISLNIASSRRIFCTATKARPQRAMSFKPSVSSWSAATTSSDS